MQFGTITMLIVDGSSRFYCFILVKNTIIDECINLGDQ